MNGSTVTVTGTFAYAPSDPTLPHAGADQTEAVIFTPTDATDYTTATTSVIVNVSQATPDVSVNPVNITYGTALNDNQLSGTATWVVNGETVNVAGTFIYAPIDLIAVAILGIVLNPLKLIIQLTFIPSISYYYCEPTIINRSTFKNITNHISRDIPVCALSTAVMTIVGFPQATS